MYAVYILLCNKDKSLYVGCTSGLKKRIIRHASGYVPATKDKRPLDLIYFEIIDGKAEAFNRERYFKSLWASKFKKALKELNLP